MIRLKNSVLDLIRMAQDIPPYLYRSTSEKGLQDNLTGDDSASTLSNGWDSSFGITHSKLDGTSPVFLIIDTSKLDPGAVLEGSEVIFGVQEPIPKEAIQVLSLHEYLEQADQQDRDSVYDEITGSGTGKPYSLDDPLFQVAEFFQQHPPQRRN